MGFLGNCIWFIFGGFLSGLSWIISGVLCCCTVVGVPLGIQCFKFAVMGFCPFGKDIEYGGEVVNHAFWGIYCQSLISG